MTQPQEKTVPLGVPKDAKDALLAGPTPDMMPIPRKAMFSKDITMTMRWFLGGYQILFERGKDSLSAVFHAGSYGAEDGLWEIMPPHPPKSWGDSVKGHLTFKEVLQYVNRQLK